MIKHWAKNILNGCTQNYLKYFVWSSCHNNCEISYSRNSFIVRNYWNQITMNELGDVLVNKYEYLTIY